MESQRPPQPEFDPTGRYFRIGLAYLLLTLAIVNLYISIHGIPEKTPINPTPTVEPKATAMPTLVPMSKGEYLTSLLKNINKYRDEAGTNHVRLAEDRANEAVDHYLRDLTLEMILKKDCFHGDGKPVPPSWNYVQETGYKAEARGEVLGCYGRRFFWSPEQITEGWWKSQSHKHTLYLDKRVNVVSCGTYGRQRDGRGYQTVACVTYRE